MADVDGLTVFFSYYEALKKIYGDDEAGIGIFFYKMLRYGFDDIEPYFERPIESAAWMLIKPNIDANISQRVRGAKGGRPRKEETTDKNHGKKEGLETMGKNPGLETQGKNRNEKKGKEKKRNELYSSTKVAEYNGKPQLTHDELDRIQNTWNQLEGMHKLITIGPDDFNSLVELREHYDADTICDVLQKVTDSEFLTNSKKGTKRDFKAYFGWCVKLENFKKIMEDRYDDRSPAEIRTARENKGLYKEDFDSLIQLSKV